MSIGWGELPHLPLRCVLDHLSTKDALAATSTCKHWRSALFMYEGHKETLKLRVDDLEKSIFVTRLFKKHTKRIHVYINTTGPEFQSFKNYVLPQLFDTRTLTELVFIGPNYLHENRNFPSAKLDRIMMESLILKHKQSLQILNLMGCRLRSTRNFSDDFSHEPVEYCSDRVSFNSVPSPADAVLSSANVNLMITSSLRHVAFEYETIRMAALQTLLELPHLDSIALTIGPKNNKALQRLDWCKELNHLNVSVNIIGVRKGRFEEIIENVLVQGLRLTSLKVMFCQTLFGPLVDHVINSYSSTLKEFVWADAPCDTFEPKNRTVKPSLDTEYGMCHVNPLILMCWQCGNLRRLVIHGYWVWQYDVVGFVRLRTTLMEMEISAILHQENQNQVKEGKDCVSRVFGSDHVKPIRPQLVKQINEFTTFDWSPCVWKELHPALRMYATSEQRADYIVTEVNRAL
ncbi:uncharacterized protein LOC126978807 [Leptidea sinapis]|uniref:F-box domain-containing protein n=1 Tax=Leptidea sinapis TaxID=189913 RepID=A0A5E4QMB4_9NEOP|nr:uncharacterized protein LOC126978807 [Leptidea sinapis]VVC99388.1 unnamed protein product [Leptidea sinapis]